MGVILVRMIVVTAFTLLAAPSIAEPTYFDKTTCMHDWQPARPVAFPEVSATGLARVDVYVNERGAVDRVALVEGAPSSALVKQLLVAAPKMTFAPAHCDGKVVGELDHLVYRFPVTAAPTAPPTAAP